MGKEKGKEGRGKGEEETRKKKKKWALPGIEPVTSLLKSWEEEDE